MRTVTDLLIRDLAQVATPRGSGPLRGASLRDVRVTDDAFVLCRGGQIVAVGAMRDLTATLSGEKRPERRGWWTQRAAISRR